MKSKCLLWLSAVLSFANIADAAPNSWTNTAATGLWQDATKWSLFAAPTSTHTAVFITNVNTKTVTINSATPAANLTISNLTVQGVGTGINSLQLTNAPASTLRIINGLSVGTNAVLTVTNTALQVDGLSSGDSIINGTVNVRGGGRITATTTVIGNLAANTGTLNIAGGTNVLTGVMDIGAVTAQATGTVLVTAGQFLATNSPAVVNVGVAGHGAFTITNGTARIRGINVANGGGSHGTLTIGGGQLIVNNVFNLNIANGVNSTGTVWATGGQLFVTNGPSTIVIVIGNANSGAMTVSNAVVVANNIVLANNSGARGTLTAAAGTNTVLTKMTLGTFDCNATGTVIVAGGRLFVTNAASTAVLEVRSGTVQLNSGTLVINSLVITNVCGHFTKTGGSLSITTTNLTPSFDADGDGFSNQQESDAGSSPFDVLSTPPATVTSWTNSTGQWEVSANWSSGAPTSTFQQVLITNAATKTVTINSATPTGNLTISNLTVQGFGAGINTLQLTNAPASTLVIRSTLTVGTNAVLTVTNSNLRVESNSGDDSIIDGTVTLDSGSIVLTNNFMATDIGVTGRGSVTVKSGTLRCGSVFVAFNPSTAGTLTMAGGTNTFLSGLSAGFDINATGTVWVTGGLVVSTNAFIDIGDGGVGQMTVSNGTVQSLGMIVGDTDGSQGTLTITGGTNVFSSLLSVGSSDATATGTVSVSGGRIVLTSAITFIGNAGVGQMSVSNATVLSSNVVVARATGSLGTLTVQSSGTFAMVGPLNIGGEPGGLGGTGTVWVTGGQLVVTNTPATVGAGSGFIVDGSVTVTNSSSIIVSNVNTFIGNRGSGSLTVRGGTVQAGEIELGFNAGSQGTLILADGTLSASSSLVIGASGVGQMTVSNGTTRAKFIEVAISPSSQGTLTIVGGTNTVDSGLGIAGSSGNSTGTVWISGGQLLLTNSPTRVGGDTGVGRLIVSNGTVLLRDVTLGDTGGRGTWTVAGGTNVVSTSLTLGELNCSGTGIVVVAGGQLFVTNAAHNAFLDVRSGSLILNSGTLTVDKIILTNLCAHFTRTGGTLIYSNAVLLATRDDDGDGIPNSFDLDPLNAADAGSDPDGDGFTNLQEFQAGTDATNSASFFGITAITQVSTNILVTWQTGPGRTNALERTAGVAGSFSNNFATIFSVTNTVGTITNFLDVGAAANPARYYRVRLVP